MSTRSRIGVIRIQGGDNPPTVESIYCHFDGYPEGVGQMLLDHWTTIEDINRLIALGDLSSLGSEIGESHDFDTHMGRTPAERGNSPHDKGWCLAYGRDRDEGGTEAVMHSIKDWPDYGQEAEYVFDPEERKWWVSSPGQNPVGWNTVAAWHGFISIPDAIAINTREEEEATA